MKTQPKFTVMTQRDCRALLRRNHTGRLAFTFKDRVDIEPIGYVMSGEWLYGRTSVGKKLIQLKHNPWVAFQVDEVQRPFDWQSVVVHGTVYFLNPGGDEHPDFGRALRLIQRLDPRVLSEEDPVPHRTIFFRIHLNDVMGRRAATPRVRPGAKRVTAKRRAG